MKVPASFVMDDYIVHADYLKGTNAHTFESLLQLKGFQGLEAPDKKFLRHDALWNPDAVGSAQFVTDCNWYSASAPSVAQFEEQWGPGADNEGSRSIGNGTGVMKLGVHTLWPSRQEIMIGAAPEMLDVNKRLFYTVRGNGKTLAEGRFGAWMLGSADLDMPLAGVKQLELETRTELSRKPTLFWANARIVTKDGKAIPLSEFAPKFENIVQPKAAGQDYFGGPIKIAGTEFSTAIPVQPAANETNGLVRVDLSSVDAVRFKAVLGSDYPPMPEAQRRKVYAVKAAVATGADSLRMTLTDGRVREIHLQNFTGDGKGIIVQMTESKEGKVLRKESTLAGEGFEGF